MVEGLLQAIVAQSVVVSEVLQAVVVHNSKQHSDQPCLHVLTDGGHVCV